MFKFRRPHSSLYNQDSYYMALTKDLNRAREFVVIESPFMTYSRTALLAPVLQKLVARGVAVLVNTKPIDEHNEHMASQAQESIGLLQSVGVKVLMTVGHHRKLVVIDDVLYEGSLNTLSQFDSCEIMRRMHDRLAVNDTLRFIGLERWCK